MKLSNAEIGSVVNINKIQDVRLRNRLLNFGCYEGSQIKIKQTAPLGDPVIITIRDTEIAVRKSDAEKVEVEVCQ